MTGMYFHVYHAHQPLWLDTEKKCWVGNLQQMYFHEPFRKTALRIYQSYINLGSFVLDMGKDSGFRAMVSFSGTLLGQLRELDELGVFKKEGLPSFYEVYSEALSQYPDHLELLAIPWSFPYLIKTIPSVDYDRQIARNLESIRECFGEDIVKRVSGLAIPEFALPQQDDLFQLIHGAQRNGLNWILVDERNLSSFDGDSVGRGRPYTLMGQSTNSDINSITVLPCTGQISQSSPGGVTGAHNILLREQRKSPVPVYIGGACDLSGSHYMQTGHWEELKHAYSGSALLRSNQDIVTCRTGSQILKDEMAIRHKTRELPGSMIGTFSPAQSVGALGGFKLNSFWWYDGYDTLNEKTLEISRMHNQARLDLNRNLDMQSPIGKKFDEAEKALFILEDSSYRFWGEHGNIARSALDVAEHAESKVKEFVMAVRTQDPNLQ